MSGVNVLLLTESSTGVCHLRYSGVYRLATEIRKYGYTCQVIDFFTLFTFKEWKIIIDKYIDNNTLLIGFSTTFIQPIYKDIIDGYQSITKEFKQRNKNILVGRGNQKKFYGFEFKNFLSLLGMFKRKNSNIKFICGGNGGTQEIKSIEKIEGFCDEKIIEYLKKYDVKNINKNNIENFDFTKSQILWHESDNILHNEALSIETSRGCIYKCKFCDSPLTGRKKFDYIKEPEILKEEFERNYDLFKTTKYILSDNTYNDSIYKLEMLYNKVFSKLKFKVEIATFARLDLLYNYREQLSLLNESGIKHLHCGVESINRETQKFVGKDLSLEKIKEITIYINENYPDLKINGHFIFGLPYETQNSLKIMHDWLIEEGLKYFNCILLSPFFLGRQTENTYISKNKKELGYFHPNEFFKMDWKNNNGFSYVDCMNYTFSVKNNLIEKQKMSHSGFRQIMSSCMKDVVPQDLNEFEKLEYIVNLYKQRILL